MDGTYYPNVPGARTIAEGRPLYIDGHRVSATVSSGMYHLYQGTRLLEDGPVADIDGEPTGFFGRRALELTRTADAATEDAAYVQDTEVMIAAANLAQTNLETAKVLTLHRTSLQLRAAKFARLTGWGRVNGWGDYVRLHVMAKNLLADRR